MHGPNPHPGRTRPSWAGLVLAAACAAGGAYYAGRADLVPVSARAPTPAENWSGVWFRQRDLAADGYELPAVELRKGVRGLSGRMITAGPTGDVGRDLEDLVAGEDGLAFVNAAGGRIKYRMVRTGPESADLCAVPDPAFDLAAYLLVTPAGGGASSHSPARREKALQHLNAPRGPERVARMVRVTLTPPAAASATPDDAPPRRPAR